LAPADFPDFPRYGLRYTIIVACQSKYDLRVLHVTDESIIEAVVNMPVELFFEDTASGPKHELNMHWISEEQKGWGS
jgi:hypothetical protein